MADFNEYKGVWVFCEQRQGALMSTDFELVSEARKLADELGCEVTGLLLGDNVEGLAERLTATVEVSRNYRSFSGLTDGMDGAVRFIYRTEAIG